MPPEKRIRFELLSLEIRLREGQAATYEHRIEPGIMPAGRLTSPSDYYDTFLKRLLPPPPLLHMWYKREFAAFSLQRQPHKAITFRQ